MSEKHDPVSVLALNPAVDISYEIPQLLEYQKVRASKTLYHPGGNGINIARALTELSLIHISEPTRLLRRSRMPSSA